jgi:hypothetical protein
MPRRSLHIEDGKASGNFGPPNDCEENNLTDMITWPAREKVLLSLSCYLFGGLYIIEARVTLSNVASNKTLDHNPPHKLKILKKFYK